jgi:hypothetical protein
VYIEAASKEMLAKSQLRLLDSSAWRFKETNMYQHRDHKEAQEMLRKAGFSWAEINRLTSFCREFILGEMDQTSAEHRRLEFARWLFLTGKLTDQGR